MDPMGIVMLKPLPWPWFSDTTTWVLRCWCATPPETPLKKDHKLQKKIKHTERGPNPNWLCICMYTCTHSSHLSIYLSTYLSIYLARGYQFWQIGISCDNWRWLQKLIQPSKTLEKFRKMRWTSLKTDYLYWCETKGTRILTHSQSMVSSTCLIGGTLNFWKF